MWKLSACNSQEDQFDKEQHWVLKAYHLRSRYARDGSKVKAILHASSALLKLDVSIGRTSGCGIYVTLEIYGFHPCHCTLMLLRSVQPVAFFSQMLSDKVQDPTCTLILYSEWVLGEQFMKMHYCGKWKIQEEKQTRNSPLSLRRK